MACLKNMLCINNKCSFFLKLFAILLQIYGFICRKKNICTIYIKLFKTLHETRRETYHHSGA